MNVYLLHPTQFLLRLALIAITLIVSTGAGLAQQWTALTGTSLYVHRIKVFDNPAMVVACGDLAPPLNEMINSNMEFFSGEGFRVSTDGGVTWSDRRLDGFSVRDIVRLPNNPQYWIASVVKPFTNTGGIVRSTDGGVTWSTTPENDFLRIEQFLVQNGDPIRILSAQVNTASGFQVSTDSAFTFFAPSNEPVQTRSIEFSQADSTILYMAGDGRGLPGVFMSSDSGATWSKDSIGLQGKRVLCVAPSRMYPNVVYCGTDSVSGQLSVGKGIFKSVDYGKTWFRLKGSERLRVWRIIEHPVWGDVLIAAADSAGVVMSGNWGDGWETVNDGLPPDRIVRTIELTSEPHPRGRLSAIIGTYGHGVYRSRQLATHVAERVQTIHGRVSPQPLVGTGELSIPVVTHASAGIYNSAGLFVMAVQPYGNSESTTQWSIPSGDLLPGVYVAKVQHQHGVASVPFIVAPR